MTFFGSFLTAPIFKACKCCQTSWLSITFRLGCQIYFPKGSAGEHRKVAQIAKVHWKLSKIYAEANPLKKSLKKSPKCSNYQTKSQGWQHTTSTSWSNAQHYRNSWSFRLMKTLQVSIFHNHRHRHDHKIFVHKTVVSM